MASPDRPAASCPWCKHGEHLDAACACGCPPLSRVSLTNDRPAAPIRDSGITPFAKEIIRHWFERRHRGPEERAFATNTISDAQFWLRCTGRKVRRGNA